MQLFEIAVTTRVLIPSVSEKSDQKNLYRSLYPYSCWPFVELKLLKPLKFSITIFDKLVLTIESTCKCYALGQDFSDLEDL